MIKYFSSLSILLILFLTACQSTVEIDTIIYNAKIYTIDNDFRVVAAMAIKDGKIVALGGDSDILAHYKGKIKIDLHQKYIYPGLIDAHCHFVGYAGDVAKLSLNDTHSFEEVLEKLQTFATTHNEEWLYGRAWDQNQWQNKEFPTKEKLDALFPDRPVFLKRIDGHAALANQKALDIAGITPATTVTTGYVAVKNKKLTGMLFDDAMNLVEKHIPEISEALWEKSILDTEKECLALGLTTIHEPGTNKAQVELVDRLQKEGKLKLQVYAMLNPTAENFSHFLRKGIYKTERLNVRSFKIYGDGSLGSRGACLLHPYSDKPEHTGYLLHTPAYFDSVARILAPTDYQMCTHAIGDSANRFILQTYAKYLKGKNDRRWRIEHAQVVDSNDFSFFGKYNIIPSVQPTHATSDMYWAEDRLGKERIKGAYAYHQLLEQNEWLPLGTDFPVEYLQPFYTFYAAVCRQDAQSFPKGGFQKDNALSRQTALRGMTIWAAKAAFEEKEKGSLEVGKNADFIIMDIDLMTADLLSIRNAAVSQTWIRGEKCYPLEK